MKLSTLRHLPKQNQACNISMDAVTTSLLSQDGERRQGVTHTHNRRTSHTAREMCRRHVRCVATFSFRWSLKDTDGEMVIKRDPINKKKILSLACKCFNFSGFQKAYEVPISKYVIICRDSSSHARGYGFKSGKQKCCQCTQCKFFNHILT